MFCPNPRKELLRRTAKPPSAYANDYVGRSGLSLGGALGTSAVNGGRHEARDNVEGPYRFSSFFSEVGQLRRTRAVPETVNGRHEVL